MQNMLEHSLSRSKKNALISLIEQHVGIILAFVALLVISLLLNGDPKKPWLPFNQRIFIMSILPYGRITIKRKKVPGSDQTYSTARMKQYFCKKWERVLLFLKITFQWLTRGNIYPVTAINTYSTLYVRNIMIMKLYI